MLITGKTKSGFKYQIQKERVEDWEYLALVAEAEENPLVLPKVVKLLLGKEQNAALIEHIRTEEGYVPAKKIMGEFKEILDNPKLKK